MQQKGSYERIPFYDEQPMLCRSTLSELSPGESTPLSYHEHTEIKHFLSGGAEIECEGVSYIAEAGDVFLFNPNESHATRWLFGTPRYQLIILSPSLLRGVERSFIDSTYLLPYAEGRLLFNNRIRGNTAINAHISRLYQELEQKQPGYELMVQGILYQLFADLFRTEVNRIMIPGEFESLQRKQKQFAPIYEYISRNYNKPLHLEDLASLCHLSENRFCVLFHELTGTTLVSYINQYRIGKAQLLLKTTNDPISDIAEACGFPDPGYFSRCYRRINGYPPTHERKRALQNAPL